jgi:CspA family cold shock protein
MNDLHGKVKFFNEEKGYGFIIDDDNQNEYFFHASNAIDKVTQNDLVSYSLENGKRGLKAVNVKRA